MGHVHIIWDSEDDPQGNYWHIVIDGHGVTQEETDEVIRNYHVEAVPSRSSGQSITFGWASTGKYLAVVFEHVQDDPVTVYPLTAYPVAPPRKRRKK